MKKIAAATVALLLLSAAPAMAMNCCGAGKGKAAMCSKGKKGACCCEGMNSGNMTKRG